MSVRATQAKPGNAAGLSAVALAKVGAFFNIPRVVHHERSRRIQELFSLVFRITEDQDQKGGKPFSAYEGEWEHIHQRGR